MKKFFKAVSEFIIEFLLIIWQLPQTIIGCFYLLIKGIIIPFLYKTIFDKIDRRINYYKIHDWGVNEQSILLKKYIPAELYNVLSMHKKIIKYIPQSYIIKTIPLSKCGYTYVFGQITVHKDILNTKQLNSPDFVRTEDMSRAYGYSILSIILGPLYILPLIYTIILNNYYFKHLTKKYVYKGNGIKKLRKRYKRNHFDKFIMNLTKFD